MGRGREQVSVHAAAMGQSGNLGLYRVGLGVFLRRTNRATSAEPYATEILPNQATVAGSGPEAAPAAARRRALSAACAVACMPHPA